MNKTPPKAPKAPKQKSDASAPAPAAPKVGDKILIRWQGTPVFEVTVEADDGTGDQREDEFPAPFWVSSEDWDDRWPFNPSLDLWAWPGSDCKSVSTARLSMKTLKAQCEALGLETEGKKSDLVSRVQASKTADIMALSLQALQQELVALGQQVPPGRAQRQQLTQLVLEASGLV